MRKGGRACIVNNTVVRSCEKLRWVAVIRHDNRWRINKKETCTSFKKNPDPILHPSSASQPLSIPTYPAHSSPISEEKPKEDSTVSHLHPVHLNSPNRFSISSFFFFPLHKKSENTQKPSSSESFHIDTIITNIIIILVIKTKLIVTIHGSMMMTSVAISIRS